MRTTTCVREGNAKARDRKLRKLIPFFKCTTTSWPQESQRILDLYPETKTLKIPPKNPWPLHPLALKNPEASLKNRKNLASIVKNRRFEILSRRLENSQFAHICIIQICITKDANFQFVLTIFQVSISLFSIKWVSRMNRINIIIFEIR